MRTDAETNDSKNQKRVGMGTHQSLGRRAQQEEKLHSAYLGAFLLTFKLSGSSLRVENHTRAILAFFGIR
jgi:hypothetical protein